jgi:hypothetical protein
LIVWEFGHRVGPANPLITVRKWHEPGQTFRSWAEPFVSLDPFP